MIENLRPDPPALAARSPQADPSNCVVLRLFPKIVFLYPALVAAVIGMVGMHWWPGHPVAWGLTFVITVALNFIVLAFDFPRTTSLTLFFAVVIVVLTILLLNRQFDILPVLRHLTIRFTPEANTQFYAGLAIVLLTLQTLAVLVHVVLDYWELTPNELIHHHGLLGDVERVPAPGLELEKEIADVFEFVLLRSGRLVIQPRTQGRAIVLENVPNVNRREREIQTLLGFTEVHLRHEPASWMSRLVMAPTRLDMPISETYGEHCDGTQPPDCSDAADCWRPCRVLRRRSGRPLVAREPDRRVIQRLAGIVLAG